MARKKLSEFRAKSLLVPSYTGVGIHLDSLDTDCVLLDQSANYVVKVDQGIKKRGKQGLIRLNVQGADVASACTELAAKGFQRFIAEPMLPHKDSEERYVSFERTRDGITATYSEHGGIHVEDNPDSVKH